MQWAGPSSDSLADVFYSDGDRKKEATGMPSGRYQLLLALNPSHQGVVTLHLLAASHMQMLVPHDGRGRGEWSSRGYCSANMWLEAPAGHYQGLSVWGATTCFNSVPSSCPEAVLEILPTLPTPSKTPEAGRR